MNTNQNSLTQLIQRIALTVIACSLLGTLLYFAKVDSWTYADSKLSLYSGAVFLATGSFDMQGKLDEDVASGWHVYRDGDKLFYSYPIGTTLLHLPIIFIAEKVGWDLGNLQEESKLNRFLAAMSVILIYLVTLLLFLDHVSFRTAYVGSLVVVLGSGLFSTVGLALWNLNYFVLFSLLVIYFLQSNRLMARPDAGWCIGIFLFLGFIVRPSFAVFILVSFTFMLIHYRAQFLRAASISFLLLCFYSLFAYSSFGKITPGVYKLQAFNSFVNFIPNLIGHLISPSRGFFVFSPIFVCVAVGVSFYVRKLREKLVYYVTILLALQFFYLSGWAMWWGGGGFGNRLATETLPAWLYLTAISLPYFERLNKKHLGGLLALILIATTSFFSIIVHVVQGSFNTATVEWFVSPNKDKYPEYFWNWSFPQWLATEDQVFRMVSYHNKFIISNLEEPELTVDFSNPLVGFTGWGGLEKNSRGPYKWTVGNHAAINIPLEVLRLSKIESGTPYRIVLDCDTFLEQYIQVSINDQNVLRFSSMPNKNLPRQVSEPFIFNGDSILIKFWIKEPKVPTHYTADSVDTRRLGMLLRKISFHEVN